MIELPLKKRQYDDYIRYLFKSIFDKLKSFQYSIYFFSIYCMVETTLSSYLKIKWENQCSGTILAI